MRDFFFIKSDGQYVKVNFHQLIYVESRMNFVRLVTEKKAILALGSLKRMEKFLPRDQFCRIQKGYIVSLQRIASFNHEKVLLENIPNYKYRLCFPIGVHYKNELIKRVVIFSPYFSIQAEKTKDKAWAVA